MSDLIDRDALYHDMTMKRLELRDKSPSWSEYVRGFCFAIEFVNSLLSAESERKKGEWRHLGGDEWCCTNCGYVVSTEGAWEHPKEQGKDYCEHCGADMRGE